MSNYRRADIKGGSYFFTVVTYRRRQILCNENVQKALREGIQNIQTPNPFTIDAGVGVATGSFALHLESSTE